MTEAARAMRAVAYFILRGEEVSVLDEIMLCLMVVVMLEDVGMLMMIKVSHPMKESPTLYCVGPQPLNVTAFGHCIATTGLCSYWDTIISGRGGL